HHAQRAHRPRQHRRRGRHHHPRPPPRPSLGNPHHHGRPRSPGMTTLTIQHPSTLVESGALTRWNPSAKLLTLFVVSVSMLFIWEPIRPALLWAALVIIAA